MDEFDGAAMGPRDHPVIATLAGCAVLAAGAILVPRMLPACPLTVLLGAGAAAGLGLWAIGFAVTTRKSSIAWMAGSLLALIGVGALAGFLAHRQYEARGREDPSTFAEISFGSQNNPVLPANASKRGPISALYAAALKESENERRAFGEALGKLGVGNLNNPYPLEQNPQVLQQCESIGATRALAESHAAARAKRNAELRDAIENAPIAPTLRPAVLEMALPHGSEDKLLANQRANIEASQKLCTLLAKRSWVNANAYFSFRSGADNAQFKALQATRATLAGEAEKIEKDAVAVMKAAQEKLRAALS